MRYVLKQELQAPTTTKRRAFDWFSSFMGENGFHDDIGLYQVSNGLHNCYWRYIIGI
jgi:hypothetical protein